MNSLNRLQRLVTRRSLLSLSWAVSLLAMLGSLYFSEVMRLVPCILCWYQRILMYPLAVIFAVGLLRREDKSLPYYILPLSVAGTAVALYHNLLYYHVLPESAAPCRAGVSCTTRLVEWFGFMTIPLLSLIAFGIITIIMIVIIFRDRRDQRQ